jgi:hypothetical protein
VGMATPLGWRDEEWGFRGLPTERRVLLGNAPKISIPTQGRRPGTQLPGRQLNNLPEIAFCVLLSILIAPNNLSEPLWQGKL